MTKILMGLIGLMALGGASWFFAGGKYDLRGMPPPDDLRQQAMAEEKPGVFAGSMSDLLARAGSWQCTVSVDMSGVASQGTAYVSGGRLRSDFSSTIPQVGDVTTHMIVRDNTAYTWSSILKRGFRFPIQGGQVQATGQNASLAAAFNKDYSYDCDIWTVDESRFELPAGIVF